MGQSLYNAFVQYRKGHGNTTSTSISSIDSEPQKNENSKQYLHKEATDNQPVFKVQIFASSHLFKPNDARFKGLTPIEHYKENAFYKYTYGTTNDYNEALKLKNKAEKHFKGAFIIAFKNGQKTDIQKAIIESKKTNKH